VSYVCDGSRHDGDAFDDAICGVGAFVRELLATASLPQREFLALARRWARDPRRLLPQALPKALLIELLSSYLTSLFLKQVVFGTSRP